MRDVVRDYGYSALGTRLIRLGERLRAEAQVLIDTTDLPIQVAQMPLLAAIHRNGPISIGDLARSLGVTQPGVTRNVSRLRDLGLVTLETDETDGRVRRAALTETGRQLIEEGAAGVLERMETRLAEVLADVDGPLLDQLTLLEDALSPGFFLVPTERRSR